MNQYIVIELFPDPQSAAIVCDPDTGRNQVFTSLEAAQAEAAECQNGKIIEL